MTEVFLAYTKAKDRSGNYGEPTLVAIYKKSSYQKVYNWIAEKAERYGNAVHAMGLKYPTSGTGIVVVQTVNPDNGQCWWVERQPLS